MAALLRLLRWPGIGTAAADAAAAAILFFCSPAKTAAVAAAAALIYAGSVVLNDVSDRETDRTLHPDRPIPSGHVAARSAAVFGAVLLALGIACAALAGSPAAAAYAGVALVALSYDFGAKRWGPSAVLALALCRGGSALGAALASPSFADLLAANPGRALLVPLPWFLMGGAVTAASLLEESPRARSLLPAAAAGILLPVALAFPLLAAHAGDRGNPGTAVALGATALLTLVLGRALAVARSPESPPAAAVLVREGVFGFLLLDAAVLGLRGRWVEGAAAIAAWVLLRAVLAGRRS